MPRRKKRHRRRHTQIDIGLRCDLFPRRCRPVAPLFFSRRRAIIIVILYRDRALSPHSTLGISSTPRGTPRLGLCTQSCWRWLCTMDANTTLPYYDRPDFIASIACSGAALVVVVLAHLHACSRCLCGCWRKKGAGVPLKWEEEQLLDEAARCQTPVINDNDEGVPLLGHKLPSTTHASDPGPDGSATCRPLPLLPARQCNPRPALAFTGFSRPPLLQGLAVLNPGCCCLLPRSPWQLPVARQSFPHVEPPAHRPGVGRTASAQGLSCPARKVRVDKGADRALCSCARGNAKHRRVQTTMFETALHGCASVARQAPTYYLCQAVAALPTFETVPTARPRNRPCQVHATVSELWEQEKRRPAPSLTRVLLTLLRPKVSFAGSSCAGAISSPPTSLPSHLPHSLPPHSLQGVLCAKGHMGARARAACHVARLSRGQHCPSRHHGSVGRMLTPLPFAAFCSWPRVSASPCCRGSFRA